MHLRETEADESRQTFEEVSAVHDWLLGISVWRDDVLLTLGGGVLDDIGGFAASTYMRGIALVKVPTTLEGMLDSSIGGKTARNHARARNLIGTFFQPRLVWSDVSLLEHEPKEELRVDWQK